VSGASDERSVPIGAIDEVRRLHAEIDTRVASLLDRLGDALVCRRGCCDCCVDDLTVFPVEAAVIGVGAGDFLAAAEPHPAGSCAFLDDSGSCRIYEWRPYVCRTQGLPLRWLECGPDGDDRELRDVCPLNDEPLRTTGQGLETLPAASCWTLGEIESRLAGLQAAHQGFSEALTRIALRDLFES
jgi:uncharacterized protein